MVNPRLAPKKVLRKFVSGVGGTGKSFLIHAIRRYVFETLDQQVIVAGPTGIAARNVNGLTIHRLLHLPVEHGGIPKYKQLTDAKLKSLRQDLKNGLLLIIDEISMVSNVVLAFIHLRLSEIFGTLDAEDGWFGRINILFFGDLLQLDPVNEPSPFVNISEAQLTKHFAGLNVGINLWKELFDYDELTVNVRQQSDQEFAKALSNIRLGILSDDDNRLLSERVIDLGGNDTTERCLSKLVEIVETLPANNVCLFPTREQCRHLNEAMLNRIESEKIVLIADDDIEAKTEEQRKKAAKSLEKLRQKGKFSQTAGLEDRIEIKVGAKIMLLRNLDVPSGLVNGAIGIIKTVHETCSIKNGRQVKSVSKLTVIFDGKEHELEPVHSRFPLSYGVYITRKQFPICLAYAITIHKSQGLTIKCCVVDVGDSVFTNGQTYVALSRAESLSGLYIVNLNPMCVKANTGSIVEYNRLRSLYRRDLLPIEVHASKNQSIPDKNKYFRKQVQATIEPSIVEKKRKRNLKDNQSVLLGIRGMTNAGNNACYANSVFQCLVNIKCIRDAVLNGPNCVLKTNFSNYTNPLLQGTNLDITELRSHYFNNFEQQDSAEFLRMLLRSESSTAMVDLCLYESAFQLECVNTECDQDFGMQRNLISGYPLHLPVERKCTLNQLISANIDNWRPIVGSECAKCGNPLRMRTLLENTRRVMIFALQIANNYYEKINNLDISDVPRTTLKFGEKSYVLSGAVFHHGHNIHGGHYTAVLRKNGLFYRADDGIISQCNWPRNSKDLYLLFYVEK